MSMATEGPFLSHKRYRNGIEIMRAFCANGEGRMDASRGRRAGAPMAGSRVSARSLFTRYGRYKAGVALYGPCFGSQTRLSGR